MFLSIESGVCKGKISGVRRSRMGSIHLLPVYVVGYLMFDGPAIEGGGHCDEGTEQACDIEAEIVGYKAEDGVGCEHCLGDSGYRMDSSIVA